MRRKKINHLEAVLTERGMIDKQLVEILDKGPAVISKWVTNIAQPNSEVFTLLVRILGVRVDDLLWIDEL